MYVTVNTLLRRESKPSSIDFTDYENNTMSRVLSDTFGVLISILLSYRLLNMFLHLLFTIKMNTRPNLFTITILEAQNFTQERPLHTSNNL